ncbi:surface-adhesin E family protein [Sphingosinicella rhizophila]|uniref:Surface-adhesin protein E-like domain-containing protein n=1 Tax=Sphingosinicella rhizophila TaxID=3050082 RepID=A0ABU3Q6E8_9SPHN|nr:surface-adhesin E family protein [Sphingosinicella sp. GR2756]MDT9598543.1 hypothetical protein [Sphingosinicella sp. GR2756]
MRIAGMIVLICVSSPVAAADWVFVTDDKNGGLVYLDKDSRRVAGSSIQIWAKIDQRADKSTTDHLRKDLLLIDCSDRTWALKQTLSYGPDDSITHSNVSPSPVFRAVVPETLMESIAEVVCA